MTYFMISARDAANPQITARQVDYLQSADGERYVRQGAADWTRDVLDALRSDGADSVEQILFYVHGFSTDVEVTRARHLAFSAALRGAGWRGLLISYDWPSEGETLAYMQDRGHARRASELLITGGVRVLQKAQTPECTVSVSIMCHSMGAFVAEHAFKHAYQDVPADWSVDQALLVAGDVGVGDFSGDGKSAERFDLHAGRVTVYTNRYDQALAVSDAKRLWRNPRLGRAGLPEDAPDVFCEVDCTRLFEAVCPAPKDITPTCTHNFYFDQPAFWQDVVLTLSGGIDRAVIPTREPSTKNRFLLKTSPLPKEEYERAYVLACMNGQRR